MPLGKRITKEEWDMLGGTENRDLYRVRKNGCWNYYRRWLNN